MARDLKFQILLLQSAPWADLQRRFRLVEDLGFDLVATADHFVDWRNPRIPWLEGWTVLAAAARETTRIRLATYVTQIPFRNPAMLARQALTVDQISGGRLVVGLGTGLTADPAYDMIGIPNWDNKERVARFKEYVEIVDLLLTNETTSYQGKYYRIKDAVMIPRPIQRPRPPIAIAALGPVMLGLAARYADIWNSLSFAADFAKQIAETRDRGRLLDEKCAALGRDPATLRRSYVMLDQNSRNTGGAIAYYESKDAFVDSVERVAEIGISEIVLLYPTLQRQMPMFERVATDIIPSLKR
ncbi:MAG: LLM class flavin-dependent oxidoreductase [Alphaproteobacteria bacterium]|nr:LLM class flavin-dependent oxidoreductase [Alphaproteobacteria bacterium]